MLNKKYLIASGCSFTDGHNLKDSGSWATYFSLNNNLKCINIGIGGSGNESIINNIIHYAKVEKEIADNAIFGVQLSECLRLQVCLDFPDKQGYPKYTHITPNQFFLKDGFSGWDLNEFHNSFIYENRYELAPFYMNVTHAVLKTISSLINFIDFCKLNNYPFFIFDGLNKNIPEKVNEKWILNNEAKIDIFDIEVFENDDNFYFYKKNYIPQIHYKLIEFLNNEKKYIKNIILKNWLQEQGNYLHKDSEYFFKGNDGHPNEMGSKLWADHLQTIVENLFGKIN